METNKQKWPILLNMVGIGQESQWIQIVIAVTNLIGESRPKFPQRHQSLILLQRATSKQGKYVKYASQLAQRQSRRKIKQHLIASQW